jgi:hypothetical protein
MRVLLLASLLTVILATAAPAGQPSGNYRDMPQQQMAPPVVVVPQPVPAKEDSPLVPIVVAALGAAGLVGAAYASRGRKKGE